MKLYTPVEIPRDLPQISQENKLLMLGSCFATEIGERLQSAKFPCDVNPYGVLYNPLSITTALDEIIAKKQYAEKDLLQHGEYWHSLMHHGDFSAPTVSETLEHINGRIEQAHAGLKDLDVLFLTFGTAYVYEELATGRIVGNCHKLPECCFLRRRLSVEEIVERYRALFATLLTLRPHLKIILTVSPIRHLRDGLHENRLSKAILLLAVNELQGMFPETVFYFPAYELLHDELRDYRFYADDLVHPSHVAVEYVWERFVEACFTPEAKEIMAACEKINKALAHKPFHPEREEYKRFLGQITLKIEQLSAKFPYLDLQNERNLCRIR